MDKLSPNQFLDAVLTVVAENCANTYQITLNTIELHFKRRNGISIPLSYLRLIVYKLEKDGYVRQFDNGCSVTFEGIVFLENGGYIQKSIDESEVKKEIISRNQRMERNEARLVRWTRNLTIGTAAIVLWEIIRFCIERNYPIHH
jgi:hypothetical protein